MKINIRILYLYLFSFVGLLIVVVSSISLVNLGMRTFIFRDADRYEVVPQAVPQDKSVPVVPTESVADQEARQNRDIARQHERDLASAVSGLIVGIPLYIYHWNKIKNEKSEEVLS